MIEGEELDDVQQSSSAESQETKPDAAQDAQGHADAQRDAESDAQHEVKHEDGKPHPLDPDGDRFKQVWARAKKAEERAAHIEAEARQEREERIRLEERLKAQEEAKTKAEPEYTWDQLQAAIDAGQITMGKAMEIRDKQIETRLRREMHAQRESERAMSSASTEMNEYKSLVPNASVPGTEERQKVEREYGYLVQRLGQPKSREQALSMELAAARAAFGDLDTLRTKQKLTSKPLTRESYMETSASQKKITESKKDFKSTLSSREVQHYERLMKAGRYPGGWADVQKEYETYEQHKSGVA